MRRPDTSHHLTVDKDGRLCWAEVPVRGVHMHTGSVWFKDGTLVFTLA